MKKTLPVCAQCEHMKSYCCRITGNNMGLPRSECMCSHPLALKVFKAVCPKSPRMAGFIGYSVRGGTTPTLIASPRWCPLREENQKYKEE